MKKLLYISNFFDGTGYSHAAQDYALSLDAAGFDVAIRSIKLNNVNGEAPPRIHELAKKDAKGCEIVIQHVLPHLMEYNGYFAQNVGLFVNETSSLGVSPWTNNLKLMDKLIVPNRFMKECLCKNLGPQIYLVPHACDTSRYEQKHQKLNIPELKDKFVFYFIGENIRRKNIAGLLKAFHLEFTPQESVQLLIKTSMPGTSPIDCGKKMQEFCTMVKTNLKLYKNLENYSKEVIITDYLSDNDILNLHYSCDSFVNLSYGDAWNIPLFDSMAMGNSVISNYCGGPADFLVNKEELNCGLLVKNIEQPCFGATETFGDLNTGHENWWEPDINQARKHMREVYENAKIREVLRERGINRAYDFTHAKIGEIFKEVF